MTSPKIKKSKKGVALKCKCCKKFKSECTCGPPSKKTDETVKKLLLAFRRGFTVEQACNYAGITKPTMYDWVKKDEKLSNEIKRARQFVNTAAKKLIRNSIVDDESVDTAKWYLERRESDLYSTKSQHEVTQPTTEQLEEGKRDELDKLLDANI